MKFFVGLHQPASVRFFDRACISINRFRKRVGDHVQLRKSPLPVRLQVEGIAAKPVEFWQPSLQLAP